MENIEPWKGLCQMVLCTWDNVVGPKVLETWSLNDLNNLNSGHVKGDFDEVGVEVGEGNDVASLAYSGEEDLSSEIDCDEVSKYISLHTLTGHLVRSKYSDYDTINDVSLSVPALKFVSQTSTFYCPFLSDENCLRDEFITDPSMNSITIVFHYKYQNVVWNINPMLTHLLQRIAECLRVGLSQDSNFYKGPIVSRLLDDIYRSLSGTVMLGVALPLKSASTTKQYLLNNKLQIEWDVIITAMLTTSGCCCVIGKKKDYVNKAVDFLMLFLPESSQILCSRYAGTKFCCGLYIQGLLEDSQRNIKPADILLNRLPTAVLHLSYRGTIKFSGYLHEHYRRKQRQCRQQELNILQQKQYDTPFTTENVFRRFGESSRYVKWCLEQLETHNSEHWSRIISSFHQALTCKALDVIRTFNTKHLQNGKDLETACHQLKRSMNITEADFWLLAATAERLKPGFCQMFVNYRF